MKKIFFMLSLFLGVILAGCAELENFLTSMTFFPAITQDPSQTKPQSPTTQNNEFLEDEAIIKKALETLDKIYIPEEIKHYDFSSYELFNVVLNDNIEIEISNFNGMGKLYFDIYGVVYPNNSSDYIFKLELYSLEQQDISFEMKVSYKDKMILNRSYNIKVNYNGSYEEDDYKLREEALNTFKNIYIPDMLNTNILNNEIINVMLPNNYKLDVNLIKGDTNISFSGYSTSNPNYSYHILSFDLYHLEEQTLVFELQLIYNGEKIDSSNYQIYVNHKSSDESDVISIKDAKNRIDEVVTVRGTVNYVSSIIGGSFRAFLVDDYGQSLMMFRIPEEYINIVYLYSTIKVTATITIYNGQYELLNYENIENDYSIGQYIHPELYMHEDSCEYEYFKDVQNVPVTLEGNFKLEYDSATKLYQLVDKYYRVIILYASKNYTINYSGFISDINNHLGSSVTKIYGYMTWYQDSPELILTDNSFIEFNTTTNDKIDATLGWESNDYGHYNITEENGKTIVKETNIRTNWSFIRKDISMFNSNGNTIRLVVSGTEGRQILVKINDSGACEKWFTLSEKETEYTFTITQDLDIFKPLIIFVEPTNTPSDTLLIIHSFEIYKDKNDNNQNDKVETDKIDATLGWDSSDLNQYYFKEENGKTIINSTYNKMEWSFVKNNISNFIYKGNNTIRLVVSGTEGKTILVKINDNCETWVTLSEKEKEHIINVPENIDTNIPLMIFVDPGIYGSNTELIISAFEIGYEYNDTPNDDVNYTELIIKDYAINNNWEKGILYNPVKIDEYSTMEVNATQIGTHGQNSGKYYNSDETWRIYQNESPVVTISSTRKIEKISVEYISNKDGIIEVYAVLQESGTILYVFGNTFEFRVTNKSENTTGQVRITGIKIWYEDEI